MTQFRALPSPPAAKWILTSAVVCLAAVLLLGADGCAANQSASNQSASPDTLTIEGVATARGNEPFSAYVLEAGDGSMYVLEIPDSNRVDFYTPSRLTVTGRVYEDEWNGSPIAHIEVIEWAHIED